jgi:hypothetical protein
MAGSFVLRDRERGYDKRSSAAIAPTRFRANVLLRTRLSEPGCGHAIHSNHDLLITVFDLQDRLTYLDANGEIDEACCLFPGLPGAHSERLRSSARGARGQATCNSATRTLPLVSGLINSETTTLTAAATVPTSIGMTSPTW